MKTIRPLDADTTMISHISIRAMTQFVLGFSALLCSPALAQDRTPPESPKSALAPSADSSLALFDGQSLDGWSQTEFGGQREVTVVDGAIQLNAGDPLTGITYDGDPPTGDYELSLQARKLKGNDFFCAATFPVEDAHCTLVLGGWGGTTVGLSCLDGLDASENETTKYIKFDAERWYSIRIRVTQQRIQCWLDDGPIIDAKIAGRKISLRTEVVRCKPLGICSFATQAQLRDIKLTRLKSEQPPAQSSSLKSDK